MIDALFGSANYVSAKKMLDVTVLRHEAIASNLANVETPNYKRLDVNPSFDNQLKLAVASQNTDSIANLQPQLSVDTAANAGRADGNTVELDTELMNLDQNMVEHALETQLVSGSLMKMQMAITGKA
jgi:flagellar basal-body rod protein FlgB